jgi:hypothetical protein
MRSTASSSGPGIGRRPIPAAHRSGLGMRPSRASSLTARVVLATKMRAGRTRCLIGNSRGPADGHDTAPDRHPRASHRLQACTMRECGARLGRDRPRLRANFRSSI